MLLFYFMGLILGQYYQGGYKINQKISLPLNGNKLISFDCIELITRKSKKVLNINKINNLPKNIKKKYY